MSTHYVKCKTCGHEHRGVEHIFDKTPTKVVLMTPRPKKVTAVAMAVPIKAIAAEVAKIEAGRPKTKRRAPRKASKAK